MLNWASGSSSARWTELRVGSMVSSSPLTTRTGVCTFVRPAGELPCSHLARAVIWEPIVSLDTGSSRSAVRSSRRARNASAAAWLVAVGEKNRKCFGCLPCAPALSRAACDHAAQRKAQQVDGAQPERVQKRDRVAGHRLDAVRGAAARGADAAQVDQDDAPLGRNAVDHGGVPIIEYRGEVVQEHHRDARGRAYLAIGERGPADLHGRGRGLLAG
jgi:hypothetical protein